MYTLYIGNKNYSSWSLRPWLLLRVAGIPFEERAVALTGQGPSEVHRAYSPSGLVPCLHDGEVRVWDSLAIAEYLAERHAGLWPEAPAARAFARSMSAEMHGGFTALRGTWVMNAKLAFAERAPPESVQREVDRIVQLWTTCRAAPAAAGGPFLFGRFGIADAMYAPVALRFRTYAARLPDAAAAYRDALLALPAMQEWISAALAETAVEERYDRLAREAGGSPR